MNNLSMNALRGAGALSGLSAALAVGSPSHSQGLRSNLDVLSSRVSEIEGNLGIKTGRPVTLYSNVMCPFAHRAHIAAIEKNVDFEYVYVPLSGEIKKNPSLAKPEFFLKSVNPSGTVPALYYDGKHPINESDVCCEFIDSAYSGGTELVPEDPVLAAKMRIAIKAVDVFSFYKLVMNQDPAKDAELAATIEKQLAKFEALIDSAEGPYVLGESISLAEVLLIPFLDRFRYTLKYYRGYDLIVPGSKTEALMAAFEKRASFQASNESGDFYIDKYAGYAGERGRSTFGKE
jgi:glutathione S-transferase